MNAKKPASWSCALAALPVLVMTSLPARASGGEPLVFLGVVGAFCVMQDDKYAATPFGRKLTGSYDYRKWAADIPPASRACVRAAKPFSDAFCTEWFSLDLNAKTEDVRPVAEAMFRKYGGELEAFMQAPEQCPEARPR